jgi:cyclophilin family peptidyl-prolyl cis-trans isomerase
MIVELAIGLGFVILIVGMYANWNLYKKVEFLENVLDSNYAVIQNIVEEMDIIDSTGHFEADDEVGSTFTALKEEIKKLDNLVEEKNNAA